jgi:branched-chain amino acid transport system substrate-binding protein
MRADLVFGRLGVICAAAALMWVAAGCGSGSRDTIRIGVYGDCYGPFPAFTEQAEAGADLAFIRHGAKPNGQRPSAGVSAITVAGKRVELVLGCDLYRSQTSSLGVARRLVEQQGVDVLVTPFDVPDDTVSSLYSTRQPGVTFISTGLEPAPRLGRNVFRIAPDDRQLSAGLGAYAFHTLGWRKAVTVGENDPNGYAQTAGFIAEFCSLGGTVMHRFWSTSGTTDWSHVVRQIPRSVDGVALMSVLASSNGFFADYGKGRSGVKRRVVMGAEPITLGDRPPAGVMVAGPPFSWNDPSWRAYLAAGRAAFPRYNGGFGGPADVDDYNAVDLALGELERVHGDLSHGEQRFMAGLTSLRLHSPIGVIRVDRHHQAVVPDFLNRVENPRNGPFGLRTVHVVPAVESTFGGYFTSSTPPDSRTQPVCRKGHVPAWAR